jgi:type IV pilus assembly protein PilF
LRLLPRWMVGLTLASGLMSTAATCGTTTPVRDEKLSNTHYLMGDDYLKKKMPDAAKRELVRAVELNPSNKEAVTLLGVIFFLEGMQKVNIIDRGRCLRGVAAEEQRKEANEDFRRSEEYFGSAVKLAEQDKKTDSDSLNYLANVALHFKRYDDSIAFSKKALDNILYSARQMALATLGWAYYNKGDRKSAARELRQAIFHEPRFCVGRYRLAKVYYDDQRFTEAVEELKKVTEDKACPIQEAFQLLGLTYLKVRDSDHARQQFDQCVKLDPQSCVSEECRHYMKLM